MRKLLQSAKRLLTERGIAADVRTDRGTARSTSDFRARLNNDFFRSMPFWLPPFLLMGLFVYGAILWNVVISLTDLHGYDNPNYANLDFETYVRAVTSPQVQAAAQNTIVLMVAFTVICLVVGLLLAILVDQQIRFENTFRTIYLLPMSLSFVVTAQFWLWMYDFNSGIINEMLRAIGVQPPHWIGDPQFVLSAVIIAFVWQYSGYAMVVYLAGLRAIPTEHFEAARVDGASTVRMYWRVIVPQLRGSTISAAVVLMVFSLKAFDFLYALFGQFRPQKGADILATRMVLEAFENRQWAFGSAIAILLFLMALGVIAPYLYHQYARGEL